MRTLQYPIWGLLLAALVLSACNKVKYLNWYTELEPMPQSPTVRQEVRMSIFKKDVERPTNKRFWEFEGEAQAAYITALAAKSTDLDAFHAAFARPIRTAPTDAPIDMTTFNKKIIVSVEHLKTLEADRIQRLVIEFTLSDDKVKFVNWDKLETKYGSVDLGTLSATSGSTFSLAPELTTAGDVLSVTTGGVELNSSVTEEVALSTRFIELSGILEEKHGRLVLQSAPGRHLDGNIIIDVTMEAEEAVPGAFFAPSDLMTGANLSTPDQAKLLRIDLLEPNITKAVELRTAFSACIRKVKEGKWARTITEGDDHVELHCADGIPLPSTALIDAGELTPNAWWLCHDDKFLHVMDRRIPGASPVLVSFRARNDALAFQAWLLRSGTTPLRVRDLVFTDDLGVALTAAEVMAMRLDDH